MVEAKEILIDYLQDLQDNGQTHVSIEPEAREILMQWYKAGKKNKKAGQNQQQETALVELDKPLFAESAKNTQKPQLVQAAKTPSAVKAPSQPEGSQPQPATKPINYLFALQAAQPNLTWTESTYQPSAQLVIITEKPQTAEQCKKLTQILAAMGLKVDEVSIASLYKQSQAVINDEYTNLSIGLLAQELQKHPHELILGLGEGLLKSFEHLKNDYSIATQMSSTLIDLESLIARDDDLSIKRQFWESMLEVMNSLKLPISQKQQSYFS